MSRHLKNLLQHNMRKTDGEMLQKINECCDIMKIIKQNYVTTMDFYVTTFPEKFLKK